MAPYFEAQQGSEDLNLLPTWLRDSKQLPSLTVRLEAEIVAHFTMSDYDAPAYGWVLVGAHWVMTDGPLAGMVKLQDNLYVALRGYAVDADDVLAADSFFKTAMKREIVDAVLWRIQAEKKDPGVSEESDGTTSRKYRDHAQEPFPPSFPRFLRPFVVEEPSYTI